jgi:Ca2+-binding RTX toxin-like protein
LYDCNECALAPRATFLESESATIPAWWESRPGTHFQQGLRLNGTSGNDTIAGTNEEDYVTAGAGDDVIYVGEGWGDYVNGGTGDDDIYLRGNEIDWTINGSPSTGYVFRNITEGVGSLSVYAVEEAVFENDVALVLNTDINQGP